MVGRGLGVAPVFVPAALAGAGVLWSLPPGATAPVDAEGVQKNLNFVWTLTAAGLVLMMQIGFLLPEAGLVRTKNSVSVAQKNVADFGVTVAVFGLVGFMIMFGATAGGLFGWQGDVALFAMPDASTMVVFVFRAMFAGTAATIVSGAVAERRRFPAYLWAAVVMGALIYPVFGHWAWGNLPVAANAPSLWLASMGFVDYAGSTVVHVIGGFTALAAVIQLGPRKGKFDAAGRPRLLQGHSPVLAATGTLILFVGWILFKALATFLPGGIRVTPEEEDRGLYEAEHGTSLGTGALLNRMLELGRGGADLKAPLEEGGADEARLASSQVGDLGAVADGIGEVVSLIGSIAAQTNLLALNATIEAARATAGILGRRRRLTVTPRDARSASPAPPGPRGPAGSAPRTRRSAPARPWADRPAPDRPARPPPRAARDRAARGGCGRSSGARSRRRRRARDPRPGRCPPRPGRPPRRSPRWRRR